MKAIESYPLYWPEHWKRTTFRQRYGKFKNLKLGQARDEVLREIRRLGGTKVIMSSNLPTRQDGLFYADAARFPQDPGVAVYFTYKGKEMCFASDKYSDVVANLRAISLTIEAIRGIERWGASDMMERAFRGFTALPESTTEHWRETLDLPREGKITPEQVESQFRALVKVMHPDAGGDAESFHQIVIARENARKDLGVTR